MRATLMAVATALVILAATVSPATAEAQPSSNPPFGALDAVTAAPGSISVSGWAIDPDTTEPIDVAVYIDGRGRGNRTADLARPDVASVHPPFGPNHGFSATFAVDGGAHTACVYALNWPTPDSNPLLGCETASAPTGPPFGSFDVVSTFPGHIEVAGWAIDPDTAQAAEVAVYVEGRLVGNVRADKPRPDVAAVYPGYGPNHGFSARLPASSARLYPDVCVYALNWPTQDFNPLLGCKDGYILPPSPIGFIDSFEEVTPRQYRLRGWAFHSSTSEPVTIDVHSNGRRIGSTLANLPRPDVGAVFPGYGSAHGFDITVAALGSSRICVVVDGREIRQVQNVGRGCHLTNPSEEALGEVDVVIDGTRITARGWAISTHTLAPVPVRLWLRPDRISPPVLANRHDPGSLEHAPVFGPNHGFVIEADYDPPTGGLACVEVDLGNGQWRDVGCADLGTPIGYRD